MSRNRTIQSLIAALFTVFASLNYSAEVSVTIQPKTFPAGRGAQLSVTADGSFDQTPNPQTPPGVSIRPYGQSRNVQIINGRMSQTITQNFVISADKPGNYTIPSFEVRVGGNRVNTDPVSFEVTASAAPNMGNPQQTPGGAPAATQTPGFVRLDFPQRDRDHLYVGEMAPVRIKAYFPQNARITQISTPRPQGVGFTLHNLSDNPEQSSEVVNGKQYRTITWFAGVSVAKAGEYPVTVGLDATVLVPDQSSQTRRPRSPFGSIFGGNSPFNDPFFDDFFDNAFTRSVPRELKLTSPGDPLTIKSLPTEGRPENFSGAVGEFSMGGYLLPAEATTGEPQKIRVTVNGKGNFDRLSAPNLEPASSWKSYTPKTQFTPGDVASFSGSKTFDFNAVPQKAGEQTVSLSFSFFNSKTGKYQTVNSQEISLNIAGDNVKSAAALTAASQPQVKTATVVEETTKTATELAPDRAERGGNVAIAPLIFSAPFWLLASLAFSGIIAGFAVRFVKDRSEDPDRRAAKQALEQEQQALNRAREAVENGDSAVFFEAARQSLQERFSQLWDTPAEAITLVELKRKLPADSAAIKLFSKADEMAYAPDTDRSKIDLKFWLRKLDDAINQTA